MSDRIPPDIQQLANQFVQGDLSPVDVHKLLSVRHKPISSQLEADLWGLIFEVGDGDFTLDEARRWLADQHAQLYESRD